MRDLGSKDTASRLCPIPGPRGYPIVGNLFDIDLSNATMSSVDLGKKYYPVYKLTFAGEDFIIVVSTSLTRELCDERRFHKQLNSAIAPLRAAANDGLFTAYHGEENWELAHRLLVPSFGPVKVRSMFPRMYDIAEQLCLKWLRYGSTTPLDVTGDFTRATLDTIALCGMSYRFNSFYFEGDFHPFVTSMMRFLKEADLQSTFPAIINGMRIKAKKNFKLDAEKMRQICRDIIAQRRKSTDPDPDDLLSAMLHGRDNLSGKGLTEDSAIDNLVTFLIAGHETTSGLLSFTMYYLLKNPSAMKKATQEVDEVLGDEELTVDHLPQLKYIAAALRESLRLMPTAPAFSVTPYKDEVIADKYPVKPGDSLIIFLPSVHRDETVYGHDVDIFRPERMIDEEFQKLPSGAWKPFGSGKRGCIGRAFAWQESLLIMASILKRFSLCLVDEDYELKIKENLTLKPDNLHIYATPRSGRDNYVSQWHTKVPGAFSDGIEAHLSEISTMRPAIILYGSNGGTCEAMARRLAVHLAKQGLFSCQIKEMDFAVNQIPKGWPVIFITGSYDGSSPSNAVKFTEWLETLNEGELAGVTYAVFGCGHRDWTSTFYKIPRYVDTRLEECGARRLAPRGSVDTAEEDPFAELEMWQQKALCPGLQTEFGVVPVNNLSQETHKVKLSVGLPYTYRGEYQTGIVESVRVLTSTAASSIKAHVDISLPNDFDYQAGDNLAILPVNSGHSVERVLSHFNLGWDSVIEISSGGAAGLPTGKPISAADLLSGYVELGQLATPNNLDYLADKTKDQEVFAQVRRLGTELYPQEVRGRNLSVMDILERYPTITLSIEEYLDLLPPLRHRLYTISSAPGTRRNHASLTVSVVGEAGDIRPKHRGVASTYLLESMAGTVVRLLLRHPHSAFHPPADASTRPVIMIAAGSGIAPFRAFIQGRLLQQKAGKELAPALLFFGCRGASIDDLYRNEFDQMVAEKAVEVYRSFSQDQTHPDARECKYVQDRLWAERENVMALWKRDAIVFVCGGRKMNEAVKEIVGRIVSVEASQLQPPRYVAEVFT